MTVTSNASVLERTRELVPELRERADRAALERRLPTENIDAVRRAGSLKVLQATRNGGLGLGVRDRDKDEEDDRTTTFCRPPKQTNQLSLF